MSTTSQEERQRLKKAYKEHYRKLLEQKKKLGEQQRLARMLRQVRDMDMDIDPAPVLSRMQQSLGTLQEHIAKAEARLEVYLDEEAREGDSPKDSSAGTDAQEEAEAFSRKQAARDLVTKIRAEMNELAKPAFSEGLQDADAREQKNKTEHDDPARNPTDVRKTVGRPRDSEPPDAAYSAKD